MQNATEAAKTHPCTAEEAWSEVVRELGVRARCFDAWVAAGKLSWADARDRMARLGAAAQILQALLNENADLANALLRKSPGPQPGQPTAQAQ